jgi:hypothetical protein
VSALVVRGQFHQFTEWSISFLYTYDTVLSLMGKIDKGVNCSVQGCEEKGERSITSSKAQMASDLDLDITNKRAYLCKSHYKEWKKATKGERDNERARWA